jgi:hypothetical protein
MGPRLTLDYTTMEQTPAIHAQSVPQAYACMLSRRTLAGSASQRHCNACIVLRHQMGPASDIGLNPWHGPVAFASHTCTFVQAARRRAVVDFRHSVDLAVEI